MEGSLLLAYSSVVTTISVAYAGAESVKTRRGLAGIGLVAVALSLETIVLGSADITVVPGLIVFVASILYMAAEDPGESTASS